MDQPSCGQDTKAQGIDTCDSVEARRRMLRRGLGVAAPVVLTLASAPVAAGQCITASGFVSMPTFNSRNARGALPCSGQPPSHWANLATTWPKPRSIKFREALGAPPLSPNSEASLQDVLDDSLDSVSAYAVAAWLNAHQNGMAPPFDTPPAVATIWLSIDSMGQYRPVGGATALDAEATLAWLALSWS